MFLQRVALWWMEVVCSHPRGVYVRVRRVPHKSAHSQSSRTKCLSVKICVAPSRVTDKKNTIQPTNKPTYRIVCFKPAATNDTDTSNQTTRRNEDMHFIKKSKYLYA